MAHLLENDTEPEEYIETKRKLRPERAARIQAEFDRFQGHSQEGFTAFSGINIGSRTYEKEGDTWYEIVRQKNPAYWDQPAYPFIYPGPENLAFISLKCPRRLTQRLFAKAVGQIFRDATGKSWYSGNAGVDAGCKDVFDKCVSGKRPEPAYEIFIDGTWKRLS